MGFEHVSRCAPSPEAWAELAPRLATAIGARATKGEHGPVLAIGVGSGRWSEDASLALLHGRLLLTIHGFPRDAREGLVRRIEETCRELGVPVEFEEE